MGEHEKNKKLEKLEEKKARTLPQSMRGKRLADKIATFNERERLARQPQEPKFVGIDIFESDPIEQAINTPPQSPWPIDMSPAPVLPPEITNFEDPRVLRYKEMITDDLGKPDMIDISEETKQALIDAPFSDAFRELIDAYIAVQKHYVGKGPMYRGKTR